MSGSTTLLGGDPGSGKSTLLLQLVASLARAGKTALYASAEESAGQLRLRTDRLRVGDVPLSVWVGSDVDGLIAALDDARPDAVVVDSVQTLHGTESGLPSGGIAAIKHVCSALSAWTRTSDAITVLVAHVTKEVAIFRSTRSRASGGCGDVPGSRRP